MKSSRITRQELWRQVSSRLRQDISKGRLAPGTRLLEGELAERFGVSRGPIREALRDLARSGLVVGLPHQGMFVSTPSDNDLEEIFVFREALDSAASRIALTKVLPEEIDRLRNLLDAVEAARASGDSVAGRTLDMRFHREIFVIAGSARLLRAHDDLAAEMNLSATVSKTLNDDVYPPPALHRDILDALANGDEDRLITAIQGHYAWTEDRMFGKHDDEAAGGSVRGRRSRPGRRRPVAIAG